MDERKRPPYAFMIQEALSPKGRSSSQRFISEYILSNYPCLIHDDDHTTLLSQKLQELTQRKNLSVIINVEDHSEHHYTLEEKIYYENTGAERPTTAPHLRPANYPRVVAQHPQGGKEGEKGKGMKKRTRKNRWSRRKPKCRSVQEITRTEEEVKGIVQNVLKNVLEARVAVVAKAVVAQVARGIERQIIVEKVKERIEGMVAEVAESIVEIAIAAAAAEAEAAEADHDEVASENVEDRQNDDD